VDRVELNVEPVTESVFEDRSEIKLILVSSVVRGACTRRSGRVIGTKVENINKLLLKRLVVIFEYGCELLLFLLYPLASQRRGAALVGDLTRTTRCRSLEGKEFALRQERGEVVRGRHW
jgi:hypothetical protein